jgi:hypothetical protein
MWPGHARRAEPVRRGAQPAGTAQRLTIVVTFDCRGFDPELMQAFAGEMTFMREIADDARSPRRASLL